MIAGVTASAGGLAQTCTPEHAAAAALVVFENVSKWYGPVIGVNEVSLRLYPGITGLVGANGAGKTTLIGLAAGQLRPDLGRVRLGQCDAWSSRARHLVGYCPDVDKFYEEMSGRQFVLAMARLSGFGRHDARKSTEEALLRVGMADQAHRQLRGYSKGMRQRIKLAQALVHDPQIVLLDEPLSGIDPVGRQEFIQLFRELAEQGKCLLVSSHELDELEKLTDHVAVMAQGRIAAVGTLAEIRELLDHHPLAILVGCDQPRELAGALLDLPDVVGVELRDRESIIVRARNPKNFFGRFAELVLEEHFEIRHLETLDDSARAILGYLLNGSRG